ncbi:MAG: hypothetical protein ABL958_21855, partial [Bdellovibrionia bacterium]
VPPVIAVCGEVMFNVTGAGVGIGVGNGVGVGCGPGDPPPLGAQAARPSKMANRYASFITQR